MASPTYPTLAQESGSPSVWLVDVTNVTKWHVSAVVYTAITALGYTKVVVPAGALTPFTTIAMPLTGQVAAIASAGVEESTISQTVAAATTAAVKAVFGAAAK